MTNEICYGLFCFVPINNVVKIFGFSEFLTAVALLAVIYTVTDIRYKFRIAIIPSVVSVPIDKITFWVTTVIGLQVLLTEIWIAEKWWVPKTIFINSPIWQGILGLLFLGTLLTCMYYAFICPPIFCSRNAHRFARELAEYIRRSNEDELKVIANELARSASQLIKKSKCLPSRFCNQNEPEQTEIQNYAYEILLLIADRKFCKCIVMFSPITVQEFFGKMSSMEKFDIPIGQFARNISSEAIAQKGSFLYEEKEGYISGLLGYIKPVSTALYGNYALIEALGDHTDSPLDILYKEPWGWDADQWEAYCRAVLITLGNFLGQGEDIQNSPVLNRAFSTIKHANYDLHKLDDISGMYGNDILDRFNVVIEFIKKAIDLIDQQTILPKHFNGVREKTYPKNIYDQLAIMIYEVCLQSTKANLQASDSWSLQYIVVWDTFFCIAGNGSPAWKIVRFKVRRVLYEKIKKLTHIPNHEGAKILGFCLQVLGFGVGSDKKNYGKGVYPLVKVVNSWTKKNYLSLRQKNIDVADSVLMGNLSFDAANNRLVKIYNKALPEYLDLQ